MLARASVVAACGLSGLVATVVAAVWLPGLVAPACGILPDQGSNLSPVLAGGFFSTESPGKPYFIFFMYLKIADISTPSPKHFCIYIINYS